MIKKFLMASLMSAMILGCEMGYAVGEITIIPGNAAFPGVQCTGYQSGSPNNPCSGTPGVACTNTATTVTTQPVLNLHLFTTAPPGLASSCHSLTFTCSSIIDMTVLGKTYKACAFCPNNALKNCAASVPNNSLGYNIHLGSPGSGGETYAQGVAIVIDIV